VFWRPHTQVRRERHRRQIDSGAKAGRLSRWVSRCSVSTDIAMWGRSEAAAIQHCPGRSLRRGRRGTMGVAAVRQEHTLTTPLHERLEYATCNPLSCEASNSRPCSASSWNRPVSAPSSPTTTAPATTHGISRSDPTKAKAAASSTTTTCTYHPCDGQITEFWVLSADQPALYAFPG
jgi:hypothetical protein